MGYMFNRNMEKQMVALSDTLFVVEVPISSIDPSINNTDGFLYYWLGNSIYSIALKGKLKIVGTVTADTIDFDPAPYVETKISGRVLGNSRLYLIYERDPKIWSFNPENSFRSLLASKGQHFVNPMPTPVPDYYDYEQYMTTCKFEQDTEAWQTAENALVKKLLIMEKI